MMPFLADRMVVLGDPPLEYYEGRGQSLEVTASERYNAL